MSGKGPLAGDCGSPGATETRGPQRLASPVWSPDNSLVVQSSSPDETDELSTGVTGHESIEDPSAGSCALQELQDEIEGLEDIIDQLDGEKHALRMRLNEVENVNRFNVGDCKKWFASNFDFDRKDTPDLLAGIVESYLMQNDCIDPLPHQLIIKNSSRAQSRRERIALSRFNLYRRKDKESVQETAVVKPKTALQWSLPQADAKPNDVGAYGQFLYMSPDAIESLYATKPWLFLFDKWPKLQPIGKSSSFEHLAQLQDDFVKKNVIAIWERNHWFPIKQANGKTALEIKLLGRHHNRRKRRQAVLKERLEGMSAELKSQCERGLLNQSIFGRRWVDTILKRPNLWIPREDESLLDQLRVLDSAEPERNYHLL